MSGIIERHGLMEFFFSSGPAVFLFGGQTETSASSPTSGGQAAGEEEILTEEARAGPAPVKKTPLTLEER